MGPKADAGGKKKKEDEPFSQVNREMMSIQINDLEEKLSRSRRRCRVLEEANKTYQQQYEMVEDDRQDVISFLKRNLEQKMEENAELQERLTGIQQIREAEKKNYEQKMMQLKAEFQETKDQLGQQLAVLVGKLNTLEEFRIQKEELLCKFSKLEAKLEEEQIQHKDELYQLDRKNIVDKDRLKRDMLRRVNQIAADFRKVSNKQMADTTKRMMRENVSMNVTLTRVSEKTAELVEENNKLKAQHHSRQLKINMLEATEIELVRKNRSHMRVIRLLNTKCNTQELLLAMYEDLHDKFSKTLDEVSMMMKQFETFQQDATSGQDELETLRLELKKMSTHLVEANEKQTYLERVLLDLAAVLQDCLQLSTSLEPYDKAESLMKREILFAELLKLLSRAVEVNAIIPASGGTTVATIPNHYQEGNLGLVYKQRLPAERDDSATTRGGLGTRTIPTSTCICSTQFNLDSLL